MEAGIDKAGTAPADRLREERAQGPTHGAGEAAEQREISNGSTRLFAIELAERREHGIVGPSPHAAAQQNPGRQIDRQGRRETDAGEGGGVQHRARREHRPPSPLVDDGSDARRNEAGDEQADRDTADYPAERPAGIGDDRLGEHGGEIERRAPAEDLGDAERGDDDRSRPHAPSLAARSSRLLAAISTGALGAASPVPGPRSFGRAMCAVRSPCLAAAWRSLV